MNIIDKLVKKFDSEDVIKFSEKDDFKNIKSWARTDSATLERNLGILGLPTGMIEISGPSRSGKTTLGLVAMKNFINDNKDGVAIILSSENRDNKEYASKIGVDIDKVMIVKIRFVEEMFMKVKKIIKDTKDIFSQENIGTPKFFFMWDSLGATLAKAELDTLEENTKNMESMMEKDKRIELKHAQMGAFPKQAKMFAKYITSEMYDTTVHFVMLNHVYDKIGGRGGKQSGGGKWVEFFPCLRLRMSVIGHEKIDDVQVAQISCVSVEKNDFGSRKKTDILILLGKGIIPSPEDIDFALEEGIIEKESKTIFSFMKKLRWKSKRTFFDIFLEGGKLSSLMVKKIMDSMNEKILSER